MRGVRLLGRGLSDTFEHLLPFSAATLAWWAAVALPAAMVAIIGWPGLILFAPVPGAAVALFAFADPRRAVERPSVTDVFASFKRGVVPGLIVVLITVPLVIVMAGNIRFYGSNAGGLGVILPLAAALFVLTVGGALAALSVVALLEQPAFAALRTGFLVIFTAPLQALFLFIVLWLITALGALLVIPILLVVPALIVATVNRFVLDRLNIPVLDPLAPTEERRHEDQARRAAKSRG